MQAVGSGAGERGRRQWRAPGQALQQAALVLRVMEDWRLLAVHKARRHTHHFACQQQESSKS